LEKSGRQRVQIHRAPIVVGALAIASLVIYRSPRTLPWVFLVIVFLCLRWRRLKNLAAQVWHPSIERIAHVRQVFRLTAVAELLYSLCFVSVGIALVVTAPQYKWSGAILIVLCILFTIAPLADLAGVALALSKSVWARTAGKLATAGMVALVACIARASAGDVIARLTHEDAKSFPIFFDLLVLLGIPYFFVLLVGVVGGLIAIFMVGSGALLSPLVMIGNVLNVLRGVPTAAPDEQNAFPLTYRLLWIFGVTALLAAAPRWLVTTHQDEVDNALKYVLVVLDFRPELSCPGVESGVRIARLDRSALVARIDRGKILLRSQSCDVIGNGGTTQP
jgi:hypothetical protein